MASLTNALQQLRAERREAQLHVEKLDQAISVIESLNGTGTSLKTNDKERRPSSQEAQQPQQVNS